MLCLWCRLSGAPSSLMLNILISNLSFSFVFPFVELLQLHHLTCNISRRHSRGRRETKEISTMVRRLPCRVVRYTLPKHLVVAPPPLAASQRRYAAELTKLLKRSLDAEVQLQ